MTALLLALLLGAPDAGDLPLAERVKLTTEVQPGQVRLGEVFVYRLRLEHPPEARLELTQPRALGDFELAGHQRSRADGEGTATTVFELKMALFALGTHPLPELTFDLVSPTGVTQYRAPGPTIEAVSSLPPDAEEKGAALHDIRPPRDVPIRSYRLLWALLGAAALALAAYLAWRAYQSRKARPRVTAEPPRPLHVRTRAALDQLAAEQLPQQGRVREFYFRLSEIVRGYLGERYQFEALECTTPELLERVDRLGAPELPKDELRRFTVDSDLARYARAEISADICKNSLEFAYALLERTTPSLQPPDDPNAPPTAPNVRPAVQ